MTIKFLTTTREPSKKRKMSSRIPRVCQSLYGRQVRDCPISRKEEYCSANFEGRRQEPLLPKCARGNQLPTDSGPCPQRNLSMVTRNREDCSTVKRKEDLHEMFVDFHIQSET